jgi:hypothetical protein
MARLFYETPPTSRGPRRGFEVKADSRYLEKVAKLVPSEVIAAYVALVGFVPLVRSEPARPWLYAVVTVACAVLTPIYLNQQADPKKPKRVHLIVSTTAFAVWAYALFGATIVPQAHDPAIGSIVMVLFTVASGAIPLHA